MRKFDFTKIKKIWDKILNIFRTKKKVVTKRIVEEDVKDIGKDAEKERGYLRGLLANEKVKTAELQKQLKPVEINISEGLYKQHQNLFNAPFEKAFSWRKFFYMFSKKPKRFVVVSYNFKHEFGRFFDLVTLRDGRWALLIINSEGKVQPLITARNSKDLFRFFSGMSRVTTRGVLPVNLDEEGRFVENVLEKDIPNVIIDGNGKFSLAEKGSDSFIHQITEKQGIIDEQDAIIGSYEQALRKMGAELNEYKLQNSVSQTRAEVAETSLSRGIHEINEIHKGYGNIVKENTELGLHKEIEQQRAETLDEVKDMIYHKFETLATKSSVELAKAQIEDLSDWWMNIVLPILRQKEYASPKEPAPKKTGVLEGKYNE